MEGVSALPDVLTALEPSPVACRCPIGILVGFLVEHLASVAEQ
jgi:hypothetical protein